MPRIDDTRAAVQYFKEALQPDGSFVPYVSDDFGKVHAIVRDLVFCRESRDWRRITAFTETNFDGKYTAACDKAVRVVYTFPFNDTDTEACELCVERVRIYTESPERYWREQRERHDRWREKDRHKYGNWNKPAEPLPDDMDDHRDRP